MKMSGAKLFWTLFRILTVTPRAIVHLLLVAWRDTVTDEVPAENTLNDAGGLSPTTVRRFLSPTGSANDIEHQLAVTLSEARSLSVGVSIAGARHSMGGQSLAPDGFVIDLAALDHMILDEANRILTVGTGARWIQVLPFLSRHGLSVQVMQSYNTFTVGGSLSVNCHGDQAGCPPISSTVVSTRIMLADGSIVDCSRTENEELFSLAIGGYGLFGIILEVRLRVVKNKMLSRRQSIVPSSHVTKVFAEATASNPRCEMVYARPSIAPSNFLEDCFIEEFVTADKEPEDSPVAAWRERVSRYIFLGTFGSRFGKELRWLMESYVAPAVSSKWCTRRSMQDDCAEKFQNRTGVTTEIIHEYFLPRDRMPEFLEVVRGLVSSTGAELVNASIRTVEEDRDSFLRYADQPILTLVLMFHRRRDHDADETIMEQLTRQLIDAAIDLGGRHYLPYRTHATIDQVQRAYPMLAEFFAAKRRYDPDEVFQNRFYATYGHAHVAAETN